MTLVIVGAFVGLAVSARLSDDEVMRQLDSEACDLCGASVDIGEPRCSQCGWQRAVRQQEGLNDAFVAQQALRGAMQELQRIERADNPSQQDIERSSAAVQGHIEHALAAMPGFRPQLEGAGDLLHTLRLLEYDLRQMLVQASRHV